MIDLRYDTRSVPVQDCRPSSSLVWTQVNIMWDRRVVRGNTYAAQVLPAVSVIRTFLSEICLRYNGPVDGTAI
jgi:hypothetical protein